MASSLRDSIKAFSNPYLIEQYYRHREQYMDEAQKVMEVEIALRGISKEQIETYLAEDENEALDTPAIVNYDKKEFTKMEGGFTTNDSLLVRSMFSEHKIPFFMDVSSSLLPFTGEELDAHLVAFHVHNNSIEAARAAIAEHFVLDGARYALKYADTKERLKSFNFYEIPHSLLESMEIVDVDFSKEEKDLLAALGARLLEEVDDIEAKQQRVVFYYDSLEDLIGRLAGSERPRLKHADLLACLELLQIYCDDPGFTSAANGIAEALMAFFSSTQGA